MDDVEEASQADGETIDLDGELEHVRMRFKELANTLETSLPATVFRIAPGNKGSGWHVQVRLDKAINLGDGETDHVLWDVDEKPDLNEREAVWAFDLKPVRKQQDGRSSLRAGCVRKIEAAWRDRFQSVEEALRLLQELENNRRKTNDDLNSAEELLENVVGREKTVKEREDRVAEKATEVDLRDRSASERLTSVDKKIEAYGLQPLIETEPWHSPSSRTEATPLGGETDQRSIKEISGLGLADDFAKAYILSLLTALANRRFLLLVGHVGVGKSHLIRATGRLMDGRTELFPVRPSWLDPSDLLGFFDPLAENGAGAFRASPFTQWLRDQPSNDRVRLALLDEMNIARVENYGADLLAKLGSEREAIDLYNPGIAPERERLAHAILKGIYEHLKDALGDTEKADVEKLLARYVEAQIELRPNVVFCGTLNVDGSTEELSPKMIDRSFLLRFPRPDLSRSLGKSDEQTPTLISVKEVHDIAKAARKAVGNDPATCGWKSFYEGIREFEECLIQLSRRVYDDYATFIALGRKLGIEDLDELQRGFAFARIFPRIRIDSKQAKRHKGMLITWLEAIKFDSEGAISEAIDKLLEVLELDESHVSYQQVCG